MQTALKLPYFCLLSTQTLYNISTDTISLIMRSLTIWSNRISNLQVPLMLKKTDRGPRCGPATHIYHLRIVQFNGKSAFAVASLFVYIFGRGSSVVTMRLMPNSGKVWAPHRSAHSWIFPSEGIAPNFQHARSTMIGKNDTQSRCSYAMQCSNPNLLRVTE